MPRLSLFTPPCALPLPWRHLMDLVCNPIEIASPRRMLGLIVHQSLERTHQSILGLDRPSLIGVTCIRLRRELNRHLKGRRRTL